MRPPSLATSAHRRSSPAEVIADLRELPREGFREHPTFLDAVRWAHASTQTHPRAAWGRAAAAVYPWPPAYGALMWEVFRSAPARPVNLAPRANDTAPARETPPAQPTTTPAPF